MLDLPYTLITTNKLMQLYKIDYVVHYHINCYELVTNTHCIKLPSK